MEKGMLNLVKKESARGRSSVSGVRKGTKRTAPERRSKWRIEVRRETSEGERERGIDRSFHFLVFFLSRGGKRIGK